VLVLEFAVKERWPKTDETGGLLVAASIKLRLVTNVDRGSDQFASAITMIIMLVITAIASRGGTDPFTVALVLFVLWLPSYQVTDRYILQIEGGYIRELSDVDALSTCSHIFPQNVENANCISHQYICIRRIVRTHTTHGDGDKSRMRNHFDTRLLTLTLETENPLDATKFPERAQRAKP
jgi:hypothetical protein